MKMWSSGWNMPGYSPEVEPMNFIEWSRARDAIVQALEDAADDWNDDAPEMAKRYDSIADSFRELAEGQELCERLGKYVWWLAAVDLPETELTGN